MSKTKTKVGKPLKIEFHKPGDPVDPKSCSLDTIMGKDMYVGRSRKQGYVTGQKLLWRLQDSRKGPTMTPLFEVLPHEREDMLKISRELARAHG